jgi:hypothetical protein
MITGITEILLPEGCELLGFVIEVGREDRGVVIAKRTADGRAQLDDEWMTWAIFANREQPSRWDHCEWGHYFDQPEFAWNDFVDRAMGGKIVSLRRIEPEQG